MFLGHRAPLDFSDVKYVQKVNTELNGSEEVFYLANQQDMYALLGYLISTYSTASILHTLFIIHSFSPLSFHP